MPAEVRLIIAKKEARLVLKVDDEVVEDDLWKFETPLTRKDVAEQARIMFDEAFDFMQFTAHGDSDAG
jgi:hypothetical protein